MISIKIYLREFAYGVVTSLLIFPFVFFDLMDCATQFFPNLLATIVAGLLLYVFVEKRVRNNLKKNELRRLLKNLAGDLSYNFVSAEKVLEKKEEYLLQERFTLSRYRIEGLLIFYYQKPISEEKKFPYIKLLSLIKKFEENNRLAKSVFTLSTAEAQQANKSDYLKNAEKLKIEIVNFLNEIEKFYKEEEIILTEHS